MGHKRKHEKPKSGSGSKEMHRDTSLDPQDLDSSIFEDVDIEPSEKELILSRLEILTIEKRHSGPLPDVNTF